MPWRFPQQSSTLRWKRPFSVKLSSTSLQPVCNLPSWDTGTFQKSAFYPAQPATLPFDAANLPPACHKWFIHDDNPSFSLLRNGSPKSSALSTAFWKGYSSLMVPLELTTSTFSTGLNASTNTFDRFDAPLHLLLEHLSSPETHSSSTVKTQALYLAQHSLSSLPSSLSSDLPTPDLVNQSGRGDLYNSTLWLGRPPTNTPFHRDPNPNLLLQLAGHKRIRLFPPSIGRAIFSLVQEQLVTPSSATIRGVEMMQGAEMQLLDDAVWSDPDSHSDNEMITLGQAGYETTISLGEALFIPQGWWHSVKGIGEGVTASANWWFR